MVEEVGDFWSDYIFSCVILLHYDVLYYIYNLYSGTGAHVGKVLRIDMSF